MTIVGQHIAANHDPTHTEQYHYGINQNHSGFMDTQHSEDARKKAIAGTLLEEYLHHAHPEWEHYPDIENEKDSCVPGWDELPPPPPPPGF